MCVLKNMKYAYKKEGTLHLLFFIAIILRVS